MASTRKGGITFVERVRVRLEPLGQGDSPEAWTGCHEQENCKARIPVDGDAEAHPFAACRPGGRKA